MLIRRILAAMTPLALSGCVLSVSPLPATCGPPQWQVPMGPQTIVSTPAVRLEPPDDTPEPTPSTGPAEDTPPPPPLEVPTTRGTISPRRLPPPRRMCVIGG